MQFTLLACGLALLGAPAFAGNWIVDPAAVNCVSTGGNEKSTFCTVQAAIEAAHIDGGGTVIIAPGVYHENIHLYDEITLRSHAPGVVIEFPGGELPAALVTTANECIIRDLTLRLPEGANAPIPLVLITNVEDVRIENVTLDGGFNRGSIGVYVQNQILDTSRMIDSELRGLEVGALVEDARFRITRCLFDDILRDAIYTRPVTNPGEGEGEGEEENEAPEVGDDNDLELSGFNRFRNIGGFTDGLGNVINEGDSFLLRNNGGSLLTAQLNDWGLYTSEEIAARVSDQLPGAKAAKSNKATTSVVFEPYLGKSIFPGSVFVRIKDSVSLASLTNANPRLQRNLLDTNIDPAFDAISKLYSFTFINPDTYTILAQAPSHASASKPAVVGPSQIVAMEIQVAPTSGEGEGEGEGEGAPAINTADTNADGKIQLSELLRIIQFYNSLAYHCEAGTEDGYAINAGDTACAPHAADYAPQDWTIALSELLRIIQFYNSLGYHACPGSEDGYCPGSPA